MEAVAKRKVLTVSQVNHLVAAMLDQVFSDVWIEGEVSNLRAYPSGHLYFALKDESSQIQAVCFRQSAQRLRFELEDGMLVQGHGRLEVYPPSGKYQVILDTIEPKGLGALQKAFEQLKKKLEKEGLFAEERKRVLPTLPRVVGIVTSPAGAAIHDLLKTLRLHKAHLQVLLFPAQVQGEGASEQIGQGIAILNSLPQVDVIIVARGGGSIEDLWPFNEEAVARAIAASRAPVVTGIGHEVDFTIADFVADVRAATPTAAAQAVARGWEEVEQRLAQHASGLLDSVQEALFAGEQRLDGLARHRGFELAAAGLKQAGHRVELSISLIEAQARARLGTAASRLGSLSQRLSGENPVARILHRRATLQALATRIEQAVRQAQRRAGERVRSALGRLEQPTLESLNVGSRLLAAAGAKLDALSPLASLSRGYSICFKPRGEIVRLTAQVEPGEEVAVRVSDGTLGCEVRRVEGSGSAAGRPAHWLSC